VTKGLVGFPPCSPTIEFLSSRKLKKVIFCGSSAICQGAILIDELKCLQWGHRKSNYSNNTIAIQVDFKDYGIRPHLWLQEVASGFIKLTVTYVLIDEKEERFVHIVTNLKTPTQYVFSLKKKVRDEDLKGMKSHDYHVMMQEILHLCMWHFMKRDCKMAIICLCYVFKKVCAEVADPTIMGELKNDVAITLILLRKEFLPNQFLMS
jgi:hypothetical protein